MKDKMFTVLGYRNNAGGKVTSVVIAAKTMYEAALTAHLREHLLSNGITVKNEATGYTRTFVL